MQGVGFRNFVCTKALESELKGWVKNTIDGGVLVMVQGNETDIGTLMDYLKIGPALSRVGNIRKVKIDYLQDFHNFSVKF